MSSLTYFIHARLWIYLALCALAVIFASDIRAQPPPPAPHNAQWEYRVITQSSLLRELMLKLKKDKVYDFDVTDEDYTIDLGAVLAMAPYLDKFLTEKFNQMGTEGWQLAATVGEKGDRIVFMRPKH